MKFSAIILSSFVAALISACTYNGKIVQNLNFLEIRIDNRTFYIDDAISKIQIDTSLNHKKIRITKHFSLKPNDKNSIFYLANKGMNRKWYLIPTKTCYAGQNFEITFIKNSDTLKMKEPSADDWTTICPEFKKINKILNKKSL